MKFEPAMIEPMRQELTLCGAEQLMTAESVDTMLSDTSKTVFMIINSVCGCAAGVARPGVLAAFQGGARPDKTGTVFAGQDVEATAKLRTYLSDYPASSPSLALFKEGKVVHYVPRQMIEGRDPQQIGDDLRAVFNQHCT